MFYYIDYLLAVPGVYKKKLRDDILPLIKKGATEQMRAEKSKLPPTLTELIEETREEGKEEGVLEAKREFAKELLRENFSDEHIAKLTKLTLDEIERIRKDML